MISPLAGLTNGLPDGAIGVSLGWDGENLWRDKALFHISLLYAELKWCSLGCTICGHKGHVVQPFFFDLFETINAHECSFFLPMV